MRSAFVFAVMITLCTATTAWSESKSTRKKSEPISAQHWNRTAANAQQPADEPKTNEAQPVPPPVGDPPTGTKMPTARDPEVKLTPPAHSENAPAAENALAPENPATPPTVPAPPDSALEAMEEALPDLVFPGDLGEEDFNIQDINQIELSVLQEIGARIEASLSGEAVRLGIQDCIQIAIEGNQDILVTSFEPIKAYGDFVASKGPFDPLLSGQYNTTELMQTASSQVEAFGGFTSVENETQDVTISLGGQLHYGTQYNVTLRSDVEEGTFNQFMREYSSALTFTLTQPLLRGFGQPYNLARIRIARNNVKISEERLYLTVLTTMGDVLKSYWDLVGAIDQLRVREKALDNAENVVDINQKRLDIGLAAPLEVLTAKAGVSSRLFDLIQARRTIADVENNLKNLLSMRDGDYLSSKRILPIDRPAEEFQFEFNEEQSMNTALQKRPEMHSQQLAIENAEIERRRARNDVLPQVDVRGTFTYGGRSDKLEKTFTGIRHKQDDIQTLSVIASIPIGNRSARGTYHRARVAVGQEEQRLQQTENQIMLGVKLAGTGVIANQVLIENNRVNVQLQQANLAAEIRRLELGASTSQRVLDFQEDLTLAEVQEVQATIEAEKSLIDLQVAEGTLLENYGIEFVIPPYEKPLNSVQSVLDR